MQANNEGASRVEIDLSTGLVQTVREVRDKPKPVGELFLSLFEKYRDRLSQQEVDTGFLPLGSVRERRTTGRVTLLSEIPAQLRTIQFLSKKRGVQGEGLVWWPRTLIFWTAEVTASGGVHPLTPMMFAIKQDEPITEQTALYWHWSPNVFSDMRICTKDAWGPTHTTRRVIPANRIALNVEIDKFMRGFWDVLYNDDLEHPLEHVPRSIRPERPVHLMADTFTAWQTQSVEKSNALGFPWDKELVPFKRTVGEQFNR